MRQSILVKYASASLLPRAPGSVCDGLDLGKFGKCFCHIGFNDFFIGAFELGLEALYDLFFGGLFLQARKDRAESLVAADYAGKLGIADGDEKMLIVLHMDKKVRGKLHFGASLHIFDRDERELDCGRSLGLCRLGSRLGCGV